MPACFNGNATAMLLFSDIIRRGGLTVSDMNCFPDREGTAEIHTFWMVQLLRTLEAAYSRQQLETVLQSFSEQHYRNQQDLAAILTHLKTVQDPKPQDTGRWQMSDGPETEAEHSAHSRAMPRSPAAAGAAGATAQQYEEQTPADDRAAAVESELAALAAADPRFAAAYAALQQTGQQQHQSGQATAAVHHHGATSSSRVDDDEVLRQSGSRSRQQDIEAASEGLVQRLLRDLEQRLGTAVAAAAGTAADSHNSGSSTNSGGKKLDVGKCQTNLRQHVQNRVPLSLLLRYSIVCHCALLLRYSFATYVSSGSVCLKRRWLEIAGRR